MKPSNKTQFLSLIKTKQGDYKANEGSHELCKSASFKLVQQPTQGFNLGTLIDFIDLHNGTRTRKIPNFVLLVQNWNISLTALSELKRYFRCDDENDATTIVEDLRFNDSNTITYTLSQPELSCVYEKLWGYAHQ